MGKAIGGFVVVMFCAIVMVVAACVVAFGATVGVLMAQRAMGGG